MVVIPKLFNRFSYALPILGNDVTGVERFIVLPTGIEPVSMAPQATILSVKLRELWFEGITKV